MVIQKYLYGDCELYINGVFHSLITDTVTKIPKENTPFVLGENVIDIYEGTWHVYQVKFTLNAVDGDKPPVSNLPPGPGDVSDSEVERNLHEIKSRIHGKLPVNKLIQSFSKLQHLSKENYQVLKPEIKLNPAELVKVGLNNINPAASSMVDTYINSGSQAIITFEALEQNSFMGFSLIELIRAVLAISMIIPTALFILNEIRKAV